MLRNRHTVQLAGMLVLFAGAVPALAQSTTYTVHVDTSALRGRPGKVVFDWTSSDSSINYLYIQNYASDAVVGLAETVGGLVTGDIVLGLGSLKNPAFSTNIANDYFFNSLAVIVQSFGDRIDFEFNMGTAFVEGEVPDEFSFFILDQDGQPLVESADPLGADALFAVCVNGQLSGGVQVFSPTTMPDETTFQIIATAAAPDEGTTAGGCGGCGAGTGTATLALMLSLYLVRLRRRK